MILRAKYFPAWFNKGGEQCALWQTWEKELRACLFRLESLRRRMLRDLLKPNHDKISKKVKRLDGQEAPFINFVNYSHITTVWRVFGEFCIQISEISHF